TALLKKASALDIEMICPLHGPVWRKNIGWFIQKHQQWSSYTPEENAVMIAYASIYGNTENAANILAGKLAEAGVRNIVIYDVSVTHPSILVAESFRCSHLVFASTTYNAGIFCNMETLLLDLKAHNLQNRTIA
ncbi:MAG: FprA family A-type flavoprotein, partial [Hungatella sp.]